MDTIEPLHVDPERGLSAQQVQDRLDAGLHGGTAQGAGLSEREIILRHCLTFFNFIFIFLAVLLLIGRSSPKNMGFLGVVTSSTPSSALSRRSGPSGRWRSCPWWPGGR